MRTTRKLLVLVLALCLCLTSACGAEDLLGRLTGGRSDAALDGSGTDTAGTVLPGTEIVSGSATDAAPQPTALPENSGTDFSALPAEQCVQDDWPDPGVLPRITLDCPGAGEINQSIQDAFASVADDPLWELHYLCAKGAGRVLSIVMVQRANDWAMYTPYNLDLTTGQALSGAELLALLGQDENELAQLEQAVLGEEFTHQFGDMKDQTDPEFYDGQYARTTSPDNVELERLWFSGDGQLCFAGRIYGLAGAEYYEYQLSTGRVF